MNQKKKKKVSVEKMNSGLRRKVHLSIRKGVSLPPLKKCNTCCSPSKFHCPFCLPVFFKPTKRSRLRIHLDIHLRKAFHIGEYTVHRCGLDCNKRPHYHCLYCTETLVRRRDFISHIPKCNQAEQQRAQDAAMKYEERENDSGDITVIPESDDNSSKGASSSSQLVSPIIPKSNKCDTVVKKKRSVEPQSSKCHQTVQTDFDKPQDCDEYYFMNLVKMFKKLSPQKKVEVRMKMERLLFEAEFE